VEAALVLIVARVVAGTPFGLLRKSALAAVPVL
jgi:hypothetical protein